MNGLTLLLVLIAVGVTYVSCRMAKARQDVVDALDEVEDRRWFEQLRATKDADGWPSTPMTFDEQASSAMRVASGLHAVNVRPGRREHTDGVR